MFKEIVKKVVSQKTINNYYHLPNAILAKMYYGSPARRLKVIGVTGTDGKTTTTNMIYQVLKAAGKKVSMISTINAMIADQSHDTGFHVTSPDPYLVQKFASKALKSGDEYLILEVTSHALDQYRFWGIKFYIVVITNITHEHLDYHKTFENYLNTKLKLLKYVKFAIVNDNLKHKVGRSSKGMLQKIFTFGLTSGDFNQKDLKLKLKIFGDYNIENALAALAVAYVLDIKKEVAQKALENFGEIKGRMNEIKNNKGLKVFIDFGHTPNGLEKALIALRSRGTSGRLIAMIGAEGFRDVGKRAMMGEIAMKLSDIVIVTAVDPRGQIEAINKQIVQGIEKVGGKRKINYFVINDRNEAIDFAVNTLGRSGDCIGIFGKGHETSMNLDGKKEIPWSEFEAVEKALR